MGIGRVNHVGSGAVGGPAEGHAAERHAGVERPPGERPGCHAAIVERGERRAEQPNGPDALLPLRRPADYRFDQASDVAADAPGPV